jgi:hypothetical protein
LQRVDNADIGSAFQGIWRKGMSEIKVCPICGVPRKFSRGNNWNSDGTITQHKNEDHRVCFYETDGLTQLFGNIEELVGLPIDRVLIEGKRKASYQYIKNMFPGFKRNIVRALRRRVYETIADMGTIFGLGHYELLDFKKEEYIKVFGRNIYCLPLFCGDLIAAFNFVEGLPADLSIDEKDGGHVVTVTSGREFDEEMSTRLERIIVPNKPGDYRLEGCPGCGIPGVFEEYTWDLEQGVVTDTVTGRHMAFVGPDELESILRELEAELGEDIPKTIVEAQRKYIIETLASKEFEQSPDYLRHQLAMRGMGNLVVFDLGGDRLEAVVENARPNLLIVGILQGVYELVSRNTSAYEFDRDDGTLHLTVYKAP